MAGPTESRVARDAGVDVARGLAVLLMIQTHAYDGWVDAEGKTSLAYAITRALGAIPAPLFLLLAGVGVALGEQGAIARGIDPAKTRMRFVRRGLEVLGWGYVVSIVYSAIDFSFVPSVLLRADILHAIGLSIVLLGVVVVGRTHATLLAAALALLATIGQPLLALVWSPHALPVPLAALVALFVDVPEYTRFPLLPLVAFVALGYLAGRWVAHARPSPRTGLFALVVLAAVAAAAKLATAAAVAAIGGALTRRHPAVALNVVDGAARALATLGAGWAIAPWLARSGARTPMLVRLGRGSLLAYAVHIPLCYGRLASPVAGKLGMGAATLGVIALCFATFGVVRARDAIRDQRSTRGAPPLVPPGGTR